MTRIEYDRGYKDGYDMSLRRIAEIESALASERTKRFEAEVAARTLEEAADLYEAPVSTPGAATLRDLDDPASWLRARAAESTLAKAVREKEDND